MSTKYFSENEGRHRYQCILGFLHFQHWGALHLTDTRYRSAERTNVRHADLCLTETYRNVPSLNLNATGRDDPCTKSVITSPPLPLSRTMQGGWCLNPSPLVHTWEKKMFHLRQRSEPPAPTQAGLQGPAPSPCPALPCARALAPPRTAPRTRRLDEPKHTCVKLAADTFFFLLAL